MVQKANKSAGRKALDTKSKPKIMSLPNIPLWLVIIIFLCATLVFFWDQLLSKSFFWEDITELWYPFQTFAAREFAKGVLPFWNPYIFSGMPFLADIEVGFFYPLNRFLSLFVDSGGHLSVWAMQFAIIIHFFIAQVSMYSLARYWKISKLGSVISAISFAFSLIFVCHVIHPMILFHFAWFPLVLMFFIKAIELRKIKYAVFSSWFLALSMFGGHPQSTLYESMFLGLVLLWYFFDSVRKKELHKNALIKFIACGLIPFIFSIGIFSIQLLPSRKLASMAQRQDITYQKATEGSLAFSQVMTSVVPKLYGSVDGKSFKDRDFTYYMEGSNYYDYWETAYYFGIAALLLGLFGITYKYRTKEGALLLVIIAFSFLYSLGKNFFIFELFYKLPLFEYFRMPARMMYYIVLAFAVFAGFGFDILWNKPKNPSVLKRIIIVSAIPFVIAILVAAGVMTGLLDTPQSLQPAIKNFGLISLAFIAAVVIISALLSQQMLKPGIAGALLVIVAFFDLYLTGESFNVSPDNPEKSYAIPAETKNLFTPKLPKDIFRVSIRLYKEGVIAMTRNQGMVDQIMTTDGYNPLVMKRGGAPAPTLKTVHELNNVRYAILKDTAGRGYRFFEYSPFTPRAWAVHKAIVMNPDDVFKAMQAKDYDYRNEVILEEQPQIQLSGDTTGSVAEKVECLDYNNNNFRFRASLKEPSMVFFSEIWYPAWKAYLDGKPAKIYRADYCFRALAVPAGIHEIMMEYDSDSFRAGKYFSLVTFLASLATLVIALIAEKKKKSDVL